jgi:hypothetical protein
MGINLFKVSANSWVVTTEKDPESYRFIGIDSACNFLETLGIQDDEIDNAVIQLSAHDHTRANFGALNGIFIFTDNSVFTEISGVA